MIKVEINSIEFLVKSNVSVLEACKYVGITIPRFCYHETLSVAGNCRMCLVEVEKSPKPVVSCAMPVMNGMRIFISQCFTKYFFNDFNGIFARKANQSNGSHAASSG